MRSAVSSVGLLLILAGCTAPGPSPTATVTETVTQTVTASPPASSAAAAPAVTLRVDEPNDRIIVDAAATGSDWDRIAVGLKAAEATTINVGQVATPWYNEAALTTGVDLSQTTWTEMSNTMDSMDVEDYMEFCGTAAATDVVVRIADSTANQLLGEFTFLSIAICTA